MRSMRPWVILNLVGVGLGLFHWACSSDHLPTTALLPPTQTGPGAPTQAGPGAPTQTGPGAPTQAGPGSPTQGGAGAPTQGGPGTGGCPGGNCGNGNTGVPPLATATATVAPTAPTPACPVVPGTYTFSNPLPVAATLATSVQSSIQPSGVTGCKINAITVYFRVTSSNLTQNTTAASGGVSSFKATLSSFSSSGATIIDPTVRTMPISGTNFGSTVCPAETNPGVTQIFTDLSLAVNEFDNTSNSLLNRPFGEPAAHDKTFDILKTSPLDKPWNLLFSIRNGTSPVFTIECWTLQFDLS